MAMGVALNLLPKLRSSARTTVNPLRPSASSALVRGIYRRTRNPMYLGQATILLAQCCTCRTDRVAGCAVVRAVHHLVADHAGRAGVAGPLSRVYPLFRQRVRRWL
jgi:protein-S-isoprenylcysteine O-methyltransferase Ste14